MDELDGVKIKNFCCSHDTVKCVKEHARKWEKIFVIHIFNKGTLQINFKKRQSTKTKNGQNFGTNAQIKKLSSWPIRICKYA